MHVISRITSVSRKILHRASPILILNRVSPTSRKATKYAAETQYWAGEIQTLKHWFVDGSKDWWGIPAPRPEQRVHVSSLWQTNAVMTMHDIRPSYHEELGLARDVFKGQRVLELGCGPLVPLLQFEGCTRHALDPLADVYMKAGWPIYDYDAKVVNGFGEAMPYVDGYFDSVISVNALDHVDNFPVVAHEIERVVKPGGRIYFEVEYHAPTITEPLSLDDAQIVAAFRRTKLVKQRERGKREMFNDLAKRFGLLAERFINFDDRERFALWHGQRT